MGCSGAVDIFVTPVVDRATTVAWERARDLLDGDTPFSIAAALDGAEAGGLAIYGADGLMAGSIAERVAEAAEAALVDRQPRPTGVVRTAGGTWFVERFEPPSDLVVFGAGDDAQPLVTLASEAGFRVTVVDHRPASLTMQRFPSAMRLVTRRPEDGVRGLPLVPAGFAVLKMHSLVHDRGWLALLVASEVGYIGMLGPRNRSEEMLTAVGGGRSERIFGPVGLDLGADGPEQVALSVVAELLAVGAGRAPAHLRDRGVAIHAP